MISLQWGTLRGWASWCPWGPIRSIPTVPFDRDSTSGPRLLHKHRIGLLDIRHAAGHNIAHRTHRRIDPSTMS